MENVKEILSKVAEAITRISEDNNTRDRRFEELIKGFSIGLQERDMKIDKKIEGLEKQIDTKIDEQFAGLETRISLIEKGTTGDGCKYSGNAQGKSGYVPTECKAVLHGIKTESREEDVKAIDMQAIKATGMKEEHVVDYPAIPITHVFVEFEDTRTRDRIVRSANMRRYELDRRRIKISPALEPDERFDRKRSGYVKCVLHKEKGFALHWIQKNLQRKSVAVNGQTVAMIDARGLLRYRYEDVEDEVQKLMENWLTKNS